jgi:hypothetical protein
MLTTEELRAEVYRRHHKRIDASDPIFMMITINELLLADYLEQCRAMQESQTAEIQKNSLTVMDECEKVGTALINRSLIAMQQNYEAREKVFIAKLEQINTEFLAKFQETASLTRSGNRMQSLKQIGFSSFLAIIVFALGFFCCHTSILK